MKIKGLGLLLCTLIIFSPSFAQDEMFKVLVSKGSNEISEGSSGQWEAVKIGKKLGKNDKLKVGENGYIGLAHVNGKTIELKTPGTYEVGKLAGEVAKQNASASKKYVDFVMGEVTSQDEDMTKNRYKYMSVTGSVERTAEDFSIKLFLPKKTTVLNGPAVFKWQAVEKAKSYVVKITNMAEDVLFTKEVAENEINVDLSKISKKNKNLLLTVSLKEDPNIRSMQYMLSVLSDDKAKALLKEASELKAELKDESALNKLVLAAFYEEKELYTDAFSCYEAAVKLEPEVDSFKTAYAQFVERTEIIR